MTKVITCLGGLFLFGSLGAAPVGGDIRWEPFSASAPLGGEAHAGADLGEVAVAYAKSDSTGSGRIGEMSDEEKERRREVCNREFEACYDWCSRSERTKAAQKDCYVHKCNPRLIECMKKIPN
jgi:hypothetical protein